MAVVNSSITTLEVARNCPNLNLLPPDVKRRRVKADCSAEPIPIRHAHLDPTVIPCLDSSAEDSSGADPSFARSQGLYFAWREMESKVPHVVFNLSFDENSVMEKLRVAGIESVFGYVLNQNLSQSTLHLAAHYVNRLFLHQAIEGSICHQWLSSAVAASLRTAVKMQETAEYTEAFRCLPGQLWEKSGIPTHSTIEKSMEIVNQIERFHLRILGNDPVNVPIATDFLEQYLRVGGWPLVSASEYRNLASFLLALSLFVTGTVNPLKNLPPSKVAAGALVLAVKVINSKNNSTPYEFWTKKLETFSQYSLEEIQPVVQALSKLLRRRQEQVKCEVFERMFPHWARYSWN